MTKRVLARLGNTALWVLAAAGSVCIALVLAALFFNVSIMMFRTGSMEPTITTGSIALVREIPATDMAVGDIVTVDRGENLLPVTHRVTEVLTTDQATGQVTFVMRGDANDVDDPEPYVTDTVRRVFFSIPGVAPVIQGFQSPYVLGGLTLGATALVVWAFWPRRERHTEDTAQKAPAIALVGILLLAPETTVLYESEILRMRTSGDPVAMANLAPGQSATWTVDVWAEAPEPGTIALSLHGTGELAAAANGMQLDVVLCEPDPASVSRCRVDTTTQLHSVDSVPPQPDALAIGEIPTADTRRILVTAGLADTASTQLQNTQARLTVTATAASDQLSVSTSPQPSAEPPHDEHSSALASTGSHNTLWFILGVALIGLGCLAAFKGARSRSMTHH